MSNGQMQILGLGICAVAGIVTGAYVQQLGGWPFVVIDVVAFSLFQARAYFREGDRS